MSFDSSIKPFGDTSSRYIKEYRHSFLDQFDKEEIQKAQNTYNLIKSSLFETYITPARTANSPSMDMHPTKSEASISHSNPYIMPFGEGMHKLLNSNEQKKLSQSGELQSVMPSKEPNTLLQHFSKTDININSPLWASSVSTHLKQTMSTHIAKYQGNVTKSNTQEEDLLRAAAKQLFNELALSGKLSVENGKVSFSYNGQKFTYAIPVEWCETHSTAETKEVSDSSKGYSERRAVWEKIITNAIAQSPGAQVDKLPENERTKVLRDEWLVDEPLTGICTGLAIEFLLDTELKGNIPTMSPSDQARYWEKLLLLAIEEVMQLHYCKTPDDLNQEHHYRDIYKHLINIIAEKAHLKASIRTLHTPLSELGKTLQSNPNHSLVCIELKGNPVAANHTIYFNVATRTIADNSVVIQVPEEDDYGAFVDFYMERMEYHTIADRFTLISVEKDQRFTAVRKPSLKDRISLSAELSFNFLLRQMQMPNASLASYDSLYY